MGNEGPSSGQFVSLRCVHCADSRSGIAWGLPREQEQVEDGGGRRPCGGGVMGMEQQQQCSVQQDARHVRSWPQCVAGSLGKDTRALVCFGRPSARTA